MLVKDVMNRGPRSIMPETSIAEAMSLMSSYRIDSLPVAVNKELVGFVQLRDLLALFLPKSIPAQKQESAFDTRRLQRRCAPIARAAVKRLMKSTSRSIAPDKSGKAAMHIMLDLHVSQLAVTENRRLVGMIGFEDVNNAILETTGPRAVA